MWSDKGADPWVVEVLRWGYSVPFLSGPPLAAEPIPFPFYSPTSIRVKALEKEVQFLVQKGAVELAPLPSLGICVDENFGVVETSDRFVYPQSESPQDSLQGGNSPVCACVCTERRLGDFHRLEGRILAGPSTSGQSQVPQIRSFESSFSVQSCVFWSLYSPAGFHPGHGSGFSLSASPGYPHVQIPGQLVNPGLFSSSGSPGTGDDYPYVSGPCHQLGEVQSPSIAASGHLRVILDCTLFRASPSRPRVEKLCLIIEEFLSCDVQPVSLWRKLLGVLSSLTAIVPGGRLRMRSLQLHLHRLWDQEDDSTLIPWDQDCHLDLEWWIVPGRLQSGISLAQVNPHLDFWSDASDVGWGAHLLDATWYRFRPLVSGGSFIAHKQKGAPCGGERSPAISSSGVQLHGSSVCGQFNSLGLPPLTGALDLRSSTPLLRGSSSGRSRSIWYWFPSSSREGTMFWWTPCLAQTKSRGQSGL